MGIFEFRIYDNSFVALTVAKWFEEITHCTALLEAVNRQFEAIQKCFPDTKYNIVRMDIHFSEKRVNVYIGNKMTDVDDTPSEG